MTVRNFTLLTRKEGMTREAFRDHWLNLHAPIAVDLPRLVAYNQHHVVDTTARGEFPAPVANVDGLVELVFDDLAQMQEALRGPVGQRLVADAPRFMSQMRMYVVETMPIVGGPAVDPAAGTR